MVAPTGKGITPSVDGYTSSVAASATPSPRGEGKGSEKPRSVSGMAAGASHPPYRGSEKPREKSQMAAGASHPPYGDEQSREVGRGV